MEEEQKLPFTKEMKLEHWGEGPWVEEPDFKRFSHCEIDCLVMRMAVLEGYDPSSLSGGYLCGYIVLPETHPWNGKSALEIECVVHGGITLCRSNDGQRLWVGFDCAHLEDLVPSMREFREVRRLRLEKDDRENPGRPPYLPFFREPTYKTFDFVVEETKKLAEQARAAMDVL